ncbi:MAG TPA: hypothetical protein VLA88_00880 [Candidatus Saccharimonadales bacterium]|nr:hypothetical protein [Candidatus Saccharimonadales bacterium]
MPEQTQSGVVVLDKTVDGDQFSPRDGLIARYVAEGVCDATTAGAFLDFLVHAAAELSGQPGVYHVEEEALAMFHDVMLRVMPDEQLAEPGTLHAETNAATLGGTGHGAARQWVHTGDDVNGAWYCLVELRIEDAAG